MKTTFNDDWKMWIQTNLSNGQDKDYIFNLLIAEGYSYHAIKKEMKFEPIPKHEFSEEWLDWIKSNIADGQNKNGLFKVLLNHGYAYDAVREVMQYEPTVPLDELVDPLRAGAENPSTSNTSNLGASFSKSDLFIPNSTRFGTDALAIYSVEEFLNQEECDYMIAAIISELRPSQLSSFESDNTFRTSKTCDLGSLNDSLIQEIDQRICKLLGIDESYSEAIQGQYYEVGQEFKPHTDYFEEHEMASHDNGMGQRTFTVMIYLNSLDEGGVTRFPEVATEFNPKLGMAVIWSSLNPDGSPNSNSLHHAQPVLKGYKAIITKWFRSNSRLDNPPPFLSRQPNDYIPNYTKRGFEKAMLPAPLLKKIQDFYTSNLDSQTDENIPGDFIFNADKKNKKNSILIDLSTELRNEIHRTLKSMMETWCGKALLPTFVYGIRVYKRGAILKCHQDRLETHIISAIINVAQDIDEDWPLSIDDNYYRHHDVILKPGEIIFYEGGRLAHGRPEPLNGDFFANIFCHFKPIDYVPRNVI